MAFDEWKSKSFTASLLRMWRISPLAFSACGGTGRDVLVHRMPPIIHCTTGTWCIPSVLSSSKHHYSNPDLCVSAVQGSMLRSPAFEDLPLQRDGPPLNAWGQWGPDDELGRLNLITPEAVMRGTQSVKHGEVINLK